MHNSRNGRRPPRTTQSCGRVVKLVWDGDSPKEDVIAVDTNLDANEMVFFDMRDSATVLAVGDRVEFTICMNFSTHMWQAYEITRAEVMLRNGVVAELHMAGGPFPRGGYIDEDGKEWIWFPTTASEIALAEGDRVTFHYRYSREWQMLEATDIKRVSEPQPQCAPPPCRFTTTTVAQ